MGRGPPTKLSSEEMIDKQLIHIDGSAGGGQLLRTALALSICFGKPMHITNIRSKREKPGLLRQHLTAVRAAKAICSAEVEGDELGSMEVRFKPGRVVGGDYHFAIGTAGSTSLVLQTILLPLMYAEETSSVTIEGGTHNALAPSADFIASCYLKAIAPMGFRAELSLDRYGFYPAGGGSITVGIHVMHGVKKCLLMSRGELVERNATAISSQIPGHVTERELTMIQKKCHWKENELHQSLVDSQGPGNHLSLKLCYETISEQFDAVGTHRLSAEKVAQRALRELHRYEKSDAVVGEYLADQLLLPMVLAGGGEFLTYKPSAHFYSNAEVIRQFTGARFRIAPRTDTAWHVAL